jgi:hypothetical protein
MFTTFIFLIHSHAVDDMMTQRIEDKVIYALVKRGIFFESLKPTQLQVDPKLSVMFASNI